MKPIDIILIIALAVLIIGVIAYLIVKKKKGDTSCGYACDGCPSASACAAAKQAASTPEESSRSRPD